MPQIIHLLVLLLACCPVPVAAHVLRRTLKVLRRLAACLVS